MNLEFTKTNNTWVATFTATSDFAIHIEKEGKAPIKFEQSSVEGAKYDTCRGISMSMHDTVMDEIIPVMVTPLYIKVVAYEKPTMAIVTIKA